MDIDQELQAYIDELPFIDTHSHVAGFDTGTPIDDRGGKSLPQLIMNDYLAYLTSSFADAPVAPQKNGGWSVDDAAQHFRALQPILDKCRALTTWVVLREGIREMFPFDEDDITEGNWESINRRMVAAYRQHGERESLRRAAKRVGVVRQNQMTTLPYVTDHWDSLPEDDRRAQKSFLLPSLILDGYLFSGFASGTPGRQRTKELLNMEPRTHAEYLDMVGKAMDLFIAKGGASVKLLINYHRALYFDENVPDSEAAVLFAKAPDNPAPPKLTPEQFQRLQDNLVWHMMEMARDRGLPLLVHTGYSWPTKWGDPDNMLNIFRSRRVAGLNVDICHSGWPHHGNGLILARTHRGAYFNLCWTPMLSAQLGRHILGMAIDMMPMNKMLTGADCGSIESFVGTIRHLRRELAAVLAEKVAAGQFNMEVARRWAKAILHDNAVEFYGPRLRAIDAAIAGQAVAVAAR